MKALLFMISFVLFLNVNAQNTAEEVVTSFFNALSNKDVDTLDKLTFDNMQLHSLSINDSITFTQSDKHQFIEGFKKIPQNIEIEERIFDINSMVSEHLVQFQVPYEFYINGNLSHKGINVLTLLKVNDVWKISYIADTRKK